MVGVYSYLCKDEVCVFKVSQEDGEEHWTKQYDSSAKTCSHAFWKGNCRNKTLGIECEVGLRKKSYNVLTGLTAKCLTTKLNLINTFLTPGSVLSVWTKVESVLTNDGQKKGQHAKMQVSLLLNIIRTSEAFVARWKPFLA